MEDIFNQISFECSKLITRRYSTSFSLGIQMLDKKLHLPIYAIYGYVRFADEIVDTLHSFDKQTLLERFREDTFVAIRERVSLNPVLHAFQLTVNEYNIEKELIESFLKSMEMDLFQQKHTLSSYQNYIYGSAEVVGLMCLSVFCEGDQQKYQELKPEAQKLGAAFQKVNFLRDIKSDLGQLGRVYFPNMHSTDFSIETKKEIEADIQKDFDEALNGIKKLPQSARNGVYLAYIYYLALFRKIKNLPPKQIQQERIRIPNSFKLLLLAKSYLWKF